MHMMHSNVVYKNLIALFMLGCRNTIYLSSISRYFPWAIVTRIFLSLSGHILRQGILAQEKLDASKSNNYTGKESKDLANGIKSENLVSPGVSVETIAATRIQTAFRAYKVCSVEKCAETGSFIVYLLCIW